MKNNYPVLTGKIMERSRDHTPSVTTPIPEKLIVKGLVESASSHKEMYRIKDIDNPMVTGHNGLLNISPKFLLKYYHAISPDFVICVHDFKDGDKHKVIVTVNRYDIENPLIGTKVLIFDFSAYIDSYEDPVIDAYCYTVDLPLESFDCFNHCVCFADAECKFFCYGYLDKLYNTEFYITDFIKIDRFNNITVFDNEPYESSTNCARANFDKYNEDNINTQFMHYMINELFGLYVINDSQFYIEISKCINSLRFYNYDDRLEITEDDLTLPKMISELRGIYHYCYNIKGVSFKIYKSFINLKNAINENYVYTYEGSVFIPCIFYRNTTDFHFISITLLLNSRKQDTGAIIPEELKVFLTKKF